MRRVAVRQRLAALGRRFHLLLLCTAAAYGLALLASRLLGVIPDYWQPAHLPLLAAAALAMAIAFYHRPVERETARLIDRRVDTDDLFLTAALIQSAAGAYKPLVLRDAEAAAGTIRPKAVVTFRWWPGLRNGTLALAALLAAMLWLPQLDPFGREQQRQRKAELRKQLEDSRKATELRLAMLKQKTDKAELSKAVLKAMDEAKKTLAALKPTDQRGNLQRLSVMQNELSEMWRKAGEKQVAEALGQSFEPQQFGEADARKTTQWKKELQKGETTGMQKELEEMKDLAEKLAKMPEGAEKRVLQEQLNQSLENLADFAASQMNAPALNAALQRALEQLSMSGMQGLDAEALKGLQESLQLSEAEMESLAQSLHDMQALEGALKTLQLARRLNDMEGLGGEGQGEMGSMAEYMQLYEQMLAARGNAGENNPGPGMGQHGVGEGGVAPENPSAKTDFVSEKSKSALSAGRILLSMKTQGPSEAGEANQNYQQYVNEVKQGVSEAIVHEQIPPAYHETIRKYFGSLEVSNGQSPAEQAGP